jgi:ribosomal protein L11 methyltransferase
MLRLGRSSMPFLALRFEADAEAAEPWSDALIAAGALSVDVSDSNAGTPRESSLYDEPGGQHRSWRCNRLTALFPKGFDVEHAFGVCATALGVTPPTHAVETIPDADWVRATQAQFQPMRASENLWIVPSWSEAVDSKAINLRIDPGLAFGTGSHASTRLCLRWLTRNLVSGASVLDYGCGSGVLAIAAAKLGAGTVFGVDIDPQAVAVSRTNAATNGAHVSFALPEKLAPGCFDIVVANILANPLELLAPLLASRVCAHGSIVLSGILEAQADALVGVYSRWFNIGVWAQEDGWAVLAGARREPA